MKSRSTISFIAVILTLLGAGSAFAAGLLIPQGQSSSLDIRDHKVNVVVEDGTPVDTPPAGQFVPRAPGVAAP